MKRLGLACALALALAGCHKTTIMAAGSGGGPRQAEAFHHNVVFGIVEIGTVDLDKACAGAGAAQLDYQISFLNGLVGALSMSLYTPVSTEVTCNAGGGEPAMPDAAPPGETPPEEAPPAEEAPPE